MLNELGLAPLRPSDMDEAFNAFMSETGLTDGAGGRRDGDSTLESFVPPPHL